MQVNNGSAQRSEIDSLTVTFSGPVTFAGGNAAAAFQLLHVTDGQLVTLAAARIDQRPRSNGRDADVLRGRDGSGQRLNGGPASLADGRYTLTILSASVTGRPTVCR